jgi:hypothetical protein
MLITRFMLDEAGILCLETYEILTHPLSIEAIMSFKTPFAMLARRGMLRM